MMSRCRRSKRVVKRLVRLGRWYERISLPFAVFILFTNRQFPAVYRMTWRRKFQLGLRFYRNTRRIDTGLSYKAHIAMAAKLLEMPANVEGAVVECGCWKGGTTANLSLICDIVGRDLIVYDSFEGLPAPRAGDNMQPGVQGEFRGDLDVVRENVERFGAIRRCTFRKGWFSDTLPAHTEPIALCLIDVDLKSSMHDCIVNIWPHLVERGLLVLRRIHPSRQLRVVLLGAVLARLPRHVTARSHGRGNRSRGRSVLPRAVARQRCGPTNSTADEHCLHA